MSEKDTNKKDLPHKIDQEIFQPPVKKTSTSHSGRKPKENAPSNQVRMSTQCGKASPVTMSTCHGKATPVTMVTQCGVKPESGEKISIFPTEKTVVLPYKNINPRSKNKK